MQCSRVSVGCVSGGSQWTTVKKPLTVSNTEYICFNYHYFNLKIFTHQLETTTQTTAAIDYVLTHPCHSSFKNICWLISHFCNSPVYCNHIVVHSFMHL